MVYKVNVVTLMNTYDNVISVKSKRGKNMSKSITDPTKKLSAGTKVRVFLQNQHPPFEGTIEGISTELPVLGVMYIVRRADGEQFSDVYPYPCVVIPEIYIQQ